MAESMEKRYFTDYLNQKARMKRLPLSGTFELSPICNLDCRMCYVRKTADEVRNSPRSAMTLDEWKQLGDEIFDAGTLFLLVTGGEPFLWPDFRELYEYLALKGFVLSINSNGTMIDDEVISWLSCAAPSRINITLYGASDTSYEQLCRRKGMFERVSENIDRLLDEGIQVKLNASMTPWNVDDMEGIIQFAKRRNLILDMGSYMFPPIRKDSSLAGQGDRFTPEEAARYTLEYKRLTCNQESYLQYITRAAEGSIPPPGLDESCYDPKDGTVRCQAGRASYWITWDGMLLPCGMVPEPSVDLRELGFLSAWDQIVEETDKLRLSGVCEQCKDRFICHCCAAMSYAETGGVSGIPKYLCQMAEGIRQLAEEQLRKIK